MQDIESQEIVERLIQRAQENIHTVVYPIDTWAEYKYYRGQRRAFKVVIKILTRSADAVFKDYCKSIPSGEGVFFKLLAYAQFQDIIEYYVEEQKIIEGMIADYENYLASGHFISAFLGGYRED
jgi:hypothetical protein